MHANAVYARLRRLAPNWPMGHAPQGFLVLFSPSVRGHRVELADCEPIQVANRVQSPSVRGNIIKGPYLVIVVAGQYPEAQGYAPLRAYAQPIYSGRLFVPVDSEFEREVFRELLACQRLLHRCGVDLAIEKPLFDTLTQQGPCRPDFLLEARSRATGEIRSLVIEAMGFEDDAYRAAKAVTHPRMQLLGPLVSVSPNELASGAARSKVLNALAT